MGMVAKPSQWRLLFAPRRSLNARVCFSTVKRKVAVKSKHSTESESEGGGSKCPRPDSVAWRKELSNSVQLIGYIHKPVQIQYTQAGKASAWTNLAFNSFKSEETTWFRLKFFEELAKIAAEHVKEHDQVYVSGFLDFVRGDGEANNLCAIPQVHVNTLSFVEPEHPFRQSEDVNVNPFLQSEDANVNPFPQSEDVNVTANNSVQNKEAEVKLSSSGKKTTMDVASTEKLWQTFFDKPDEWWDKRGNKNNPKAPDFKHKDSNEVLWIESFKTPSWVKSQLDSLDERKHEERQGNNVDGGKKSTMDVASTEKLWQAFFDKPAEWWDNRENKKNPKAPDFKHKDSGEVLWIESFKTPSWVKSQLDILDERKHEERQGYDVDGGKKTTVDVASKDKLWQAFFDKPDEWWDNRGNKKNTKAPDFTHKDSGEALWIESFKTPSWVKSQLDLLDERKHEERQGNDADGGKKTTTDAASIEKSWQAFFANPYEWWDNRQNKKNPKAPDFKHKDSSEALWIESFKNPSWVKPQLEKIDERMKDSHRSKRSQESFSSFVDRDLSF